LERWELGSFIEGTGFEGHALGPPRSNRIKLLFVTDPNAAVATLLSGTAHTADNRIIRLRQGLVLKERWGDGIGGRVMLIPQEVRFSLVQFKPEFVHPAALLDVRVRKALAHAIDKQGLVDGLLEGQGLPADTLVVPQVAYFASLDRALAKYPYEPRSSQQLMEEAGHVRGPEGFFVGRAGERFPLSLNVSGLAQNESEATIMADSFRRAGFDTSIQVLSQAEASDRQVRSSFPGISSTSNTNGFEPPVNFLRAAQIPTPENRWRGSNRGGWQHAEFERLVAAFETTLEDRERQQRIVDLLKVVSDELPGFALYYNLAVFVQVAELAGPAGGINWNWNIHEWELRS
jgi:peptide/nickel transport system substrate-binding protein